MDTKKTTNKFSAEVRERAVRMVRDHQGGHASQWASIASIASKIGCTAESLRRWLRLLSNQGIVVWDMFAAWVAEVVGARKRIVVAMNWTDFHVSAADGQTRPAAAWVGKGGRARKLRDVEVTAGRHKVGAVVCVKLLVAGSLFGQIGKVG